jgi:hypothetical protein
MAVWLTRILAAAAALVIGFWLTAALGRQDIGTLESPLMLPIARQLDQGPWGLYGPYRGQNRLVLIHAPLYYHLAALLAWVMSQAPLTPVTAALAAGRSLSLIGLAATCVAAYRIARLDSAPARAGVWTVLLVLSAPVLGGVSFSVRPDMAGIALETTGVYFVLRALLALRPRQADLLAAYVFFALAACTKQHFFMSAIVSTGLLWAGRRRQIALKHIVNGLIVFLIVISTVYGVEEMATAGRMSQSVFVAAGTVGRIHPGDWIHVATVFAAVIGNSVGLIALLGAAYAACVSAHQDQARKIMARVASGLVVVIAVLTLAHLVLGRLWLGWLVLGGGLMVLLLVIPACAVATGSAAESRLEPALWLYMAAELGLMTALCRLSDGAWTNYAVMAVVLFCIVTARTLARACEAPDSPRVLWPAALAAAAVLAAAALDVKEAVATRFLEQAGLARVLEPAKPDRDELFFVDRPGYNRVYGRIDLVYDYWLYPVFESLGLAEPRALWLKWALTHGRMRTLVTPTLSPNLDGIAEALPELGYRPIGRSGPFLVCRRPGDAGASGAPPH